MNAEGRKNLVSLLKALPPQTLVPVGFVLDGLDVEDDGEVVADLTLSEVAEKLGRSVSTVRGWASEGLLPGAYRLRGREWRIPPHGLREFLESQRGAGSERRQPSSAVGGGRAQAVDLGSWRRLKGVG